MSVALVTDLLEDNVNVSDAEKRGNVIRCKPFLLQLCAVLVATMGVLVRPLTPAPVPQDGQEEAVEHVSVLPRTPLMLTYVSFLAAVCSPGCYNGGTCVSPNTCSCASGWMGVDCRTRECMSTNEHGDSLWSEFSIFIPS